MANIDEIRQKVDQLITERGLNYRDVSLKIGRKDSYIQQYVRYGYPRRLKEIDRLRLAGVLNVDETEIADDEVLSNKVCQTANMAFAGSEADKRRSRTFDNLIKIGILEARSETPEKQAFLASSHHYNLVDTAYLQAMDISVCTNLYIVHITSDSMVPQINKNDQVLIDTSYNTPDSDGLYLMFSGTEAVVRQIQFSPLDGAVEICASNPMYKNYTATDMHTVSVIGKVIGHIKKF